MTDFLELLAHLDVISRIEGFVSGFLNADWHGAFQRGGLTSLVDECAASLVGRNAWRFYVPRDCGWSGIEMERLLKRHGVKVWDRGFTRECLTFRVKRRQANWAEYLLRRKGIPVLSRPFNPLNEEYARRHAPGSEPPTGKQRSKPRRGFLDDLISLLKW
jgi:hypothetical protein